MEFSPHALRVRRLIVAAAAVARRCRGGVTGGPSAERLRL